MREIYGLGVKERSMRGVSLKSVLMGGVVLTALLLTGCGLQVREVTLLENVEVPTLETLGQDADPGWVDYLDGQDYELSEEFCGLAQVKEDLQNMLPGFLANIITVQSVSVVSLDFEAQAGNFNSINELDTVLTVDDEYYMFYTGIREEGLGDGVSLKPKPALNLADSINNGDCINAYLRISGQLPETALRFNVVVRYRATLGLSLF